MAKELVMILAGGKGSRLHPLSRDRAKPAVPFGGKYRVIDFVLSNFTNSGFYQIKVLTQFKSDSLSRHISLGWKLASQLDQYVDLVPPQMRVGDTWYLGTADAVYQNINLIMDEHPENVFIFGGDHVYKMDVRQMLNFHKSSDADLTVAAVGLPIKRASQMGIIEVDRHGRIKSFVEKPENPKHMPGKRNLALVSMGNYIFKREALINALIEDHEDKSSSHDFGRNIIPRMIEKNKVYAYDFAANTWPGMEDKERGYWCDIGTLDVYWEANMDLCNRDPKINLHNQEWPIRTAFRHHYPPAKFVFAFDSVDRKGRATNSLVSEGCIISGGRIDKCVLSRAVKINSYVELNECVLMERVEIGRYCKIRRAIIDKGVYVPPQTVIGYDLERDKKHYHVTESGVVVIPKREKIQPE